VATSPHRIRFIRFIRASPALFADRPLAVFCGWDDILVNVRKTPAPGQIVRRFVKGSA